MFISFTNRMSSFSPTESKSDAMCLVWFSIVCFLGYFSVCVSVFETEEKNPKYLRCPSLYNYIGSFVHVRLAGLTVKFLSGFHLPG